MKKFRKPFITYSWYIHEKDWGKETFEMFAGRMSLKTIGLYKPPEKEGRTIKLIKEVTTYEEISL